ncbi:MAG: MG2 domain-containing protein, partial [Ignavibacteria bacterium]
MFKSFKPALLSTIFFIALSLLACKNSFSQQNQALTNYNLSFNLYTNNYYTSNQDVSITIDAYSIPKKPEFEFKIYKIRDVEAFFSRQTSTYTIDILSRDSTNLLYLCDEVDNFTKTLKTDGSSDYYYSYETITYKPKQKGAFVIRASYGNKVAYAGFFVSDIGMITEAGANAMLAYTIDRKTGETVNDVSLTYFLGPRKIGVGKTMNGLFYKDLNDEDRDYAAANNISYPMIIGKYGDDIVVSDPYLYFGYGSNLYSVYIFPNQPVYRPKAKVEFKGVIRKSNAGEYENYPSKDVTVIIKDSKNAEVYKQVLKTNSNGSFDGTYDIPDNAPVGVYYIYATLGENQTYTGTFSVEEYKKPEYKVDVTLDKDQYGDGDEMKGVVQADYYFGSPVQEATVEYNVYKQTFYRPWWYFSEYKWWYEDYYSQETDNQKYNNAEYIYSGTGTLDKEGRFDFSYNIKEDFKSKYNYGWYWYDESGYDNYYSDCIYIIQAKVTDKSRRQISSTKTVYVTRAQFYLTANVDKYLYKPGETVIVQVHSNDFSDKAVKADFTGTVNRITWGKYPDYKQEKNFVTTFSGTTREDGFGSATFEAKDEGYYQIEVSSTDSRGKKVTTTTYAYVSNGDFWWWYNQSGTVQIIPDKDTYKPGEICRAMILTTTPGASVLVTTQNDNILSYNVYKIEGTSKMLEFPVDSKSSPNFYINVSYVKDGAFYTGSKSVMVIPEDKFLNVEVTTDKPTYKPKEEGTMTVKITDNKGVPVSNAELSLGVVDEAIYAIQPDATKDVRKFYYSPKWNDVGVHYSNSYSYYGYSRLITIYERFNVKNTSESELGTVKGRLVDKTENPVAYATIVIDGDFVACSTDDQGNFEFKLPEGSYDISVYTGKKSKDSEKELEVKKGKTITINLMVDSEGLYYSDYKSGEDRGGLDIQSGNIQADEMSQG